MERDGTTIRTFVVVSLSFRMCGELLRNKVARLWQISVAARSHSDEARKRTCSGDGVA
jgi:hypothetical protein